MGITLPSFVIQVKVVVRVFVGIITVKRHCSTEVQILYANTITNYYFPRVTRNRTTSWNSPSNGFIKDRSKCSDRWQHFIVVPFRAPTSPVILWFNLKQNINYNSKFDSTFTFYIIFVLPEYKSTEIHLMEHRHFHMFLRACEIMLYYTKCP